MAKEIYVGVDGRARKAKALYVGVDGKARRVKKVYVGVGGKARLAWEDDPYPYLPSSFHGTLAIIGESRWGDTVTIYEETATFIRNRLIYTAPFGGIDVNLSGCMVTGCVLDTDLSYESSGSLFTGALLETSAGERIPMSQPFPGPAHFQADVTQSTLTDALAVDGLKFTVTVMASNP